MGGVKNCLVRCDEFVDYPLGDRRVKCKELGREFTNPLPSIS